MPESKSAENEKTITRDELAKLLNEDLSREYQAIIAYVVYSQVLKGAAYMNIADQLQVHAGQELPSFAQPFGPFRTQRPNQAFVDSHTPRVSDFLLQQANSLKTNSHSE